MLKKHTQKLYISKWSVDIMVDLCYRWDAINIHFEHINWMLVFLQRQFWTPIKIIVNCLLRRILVIYN